jgi:hypothetical protein
MGRRVRGYATVIRIQRRKFSILGKLDAEKIPAAVPPDYRERVRLAIEPGVRYTVILFAHDRSHGGVVTSAAVVRALGRVPFEEAICAVGADFTKEAIKLLVARRAAIASIGEFGWTDASYQSLS